MNFSIFIPVYRPDNDIMENLIDLENLKHNVILQRNSIFELAETKNIFLVGDGTNQGISRPFNEVLFSKICDDVDWLLFLDQDTIIDWDIVSFELAKLADSNHQNVAAYYLRANANGKRKVGNFVTNSGTMFNVRILRCLGGFNENYANNGIDYDVCIKIWLNGFDICDISLSAAIDHESLQEGENFRLGNRIFNIRRYNEDRYVELDKFYIATLRLLLKSKNSLLFIKLMRSYLIYKLGKLLITLWEKKHDL